jgi:phage baseplate assembly protein W
MKKNVASQVIGAQMVSATDGSAFTGAVTVAVTGDAGSQATGSVGSGACTHEGNGFHTYAPAQAETNYDHIAFTFTGTGAVPVTIQVYTTFPQTGDNFARLGAPAGASVSADIAAIEAQTDDIGAAGAGLTAVPWNAAWDAEVQSEVADALTAYEDLTAAVVPMRGIIRQGTAQGATANTLQMDSGASHGDDTLAGALVLVHGSTQGYWQALYAESNVGATDTITLDRNWPVTPTGTITFKVIGAAPGTSGSGLDAAGVRDAIGLASANLDTQLAAIESQTDDIGTAGAGLTAIPWNAAWDAEVQSEATDALNAYDPPTRAELTSDINSVLTPIGVIDDLLDTEIPALTTALAAVQTSVNTIDDLLDTEIPALTMAVADIPTNAELATALDAIPTAAENAAALLDLTNGVETSVTPRQALRAILASVAGVLSGASGSTITISNPAGTTTRLTVTVDEDGNRSAVVANL